MSKDTQGIDAATAILVRGYLSGTALAVTFLLISDLTFMLLSALDAPRNLLKLVSLASGPIIGSAGAVWVIMRWISRRSSSGARTDHDDEASPRNAA